MHTRILSASLFGMSLLLVGAGCFNANNNKTSVQPDTQSDTTMTATPTLPIMSGVYQVDPTNSTVEWYGEKRVGASHAGAVSLVYGQVTFGDEQSLINGTMTIDMTTIDSYEDIERLETHLNSADFFDTATHPQATFALTNATKTGETTYEVTGDLTIKGLTNAITFPATIVSEAEATVRATATFEVDRAQYDVRFGSPSFFTDLGDALIEDNMRFTLNLVASKVADMEIVTPTTSTDMGGVDVDMGTVTTATLERAY